MKICLDPGHGNSNRVTGRYDPGATGNGIEEAAWVMMMGLLLKAELEKRGHIIVMTRMDGTTPTPLSYRGAKGRGCALFLSLHCNASENPQAHGTQVNSLSYSAIGTKLSGAVARALGLTNRGNKTDENLQVLRDSPCPAILLEFGFLSNETDAAALSDMSKRTALVKAICDAVTT